MNGAKMELENLIGTKLAPVQFGASKEWKYWEHKTFNIHRAIVHWVPSEPISNLAEIKEKVRSKITKHFKRSWWRGFGFGVVAEFNTPPGNLNDTRELVDKFDNSKGTWQWHLFLDHQSQLVICAHTWVAGYLSPIFESLVSHYEQRGYEIHLPNENDT